MDHTQLFKPIEEMDYYEILSVPFDATADEIESAYRFARSAYEENGLASYGLLSPEKRLEMLGRLEEAFETLYHFDKKMAYDRDLIALRPEIPCRAFFRKSTEPVEIGDAEGRDSLLKKMKNALRRLIRKGNGKDILEL